MKKLFTIVFLTVCTCLPALSQNTEYSRSGKNGVWFEVRMDTSNPCRYTEDNKIYQADREFTFEFHYFDPQGKERFMRYERIPKQGYELTETGDTVTNTYYFPDFSFSDEFDAKDSCINRYLLKVACSGRGFRKDYDQTVEEFYFLLDDQRSKLPLSMSGIVENERNLWMHPNRSCLFRVLELNPFPYIQYPVEKGRKWKWKLTIGSHWGDERWKTWTGGIVNKYQYKITDTDCEVVTPVGALSCVKVEAVAKSRIGKTYLTAYYNDTYGFVKMDNTNIDGSRLLVDLVGTNF
ncbi:MAG: hypothetical protein II899_04610 [Bacteroidales bacterium]|nr:hypothetical protein [Bacteroidales bacterium]